MKKLSESNADLFGRLEEIQKNTERVSGSDARVNGTSESSGELRTTFRKAPDSDKQADFFIPKVSDVTTKDSRSIMDVAVFRLSKRVKRAGETIRYDLKDGFVQVSAGAAGMATVWDYDLVLMAVSHLTEAMNLYKEGKGEKPGRIYRPYASEILKFCRRSDGGRQKSELVEALLRLNTTHVAVERIMKNRQGETVTVSEGEPLISRYRVITRTSNGHPQQVEIELPLWIYNEIVEASIPGVLSVHPDFFLISDGMGRFIYRLARRAAGQSHATWGFRTIKKRSGSSASDSEFFRMLRKIVLTNDLPEYQLAEVKGKEGPMLVMTRRQEAVASQEQ